MKTAGRENQKRWLNEPASRDPERNARTILLKRGGLEAKKKSGHRRGVFFLTPFIERSVSHATLVPLGQPEKAVGHESPIEPWLAPDNRCCLWVSERTGFVAQKR